MLPEMVLQESASHGRRFSAMFGHRIDADDIAQQGAMLFYAGKPIPTVAEGARLANCCHRAAHELWRNTPDATVEMPEEPTVPSGETAVDDADSFAALLGDIPGELRPLAVLLASGYTAHHARGLLGLSLRQYYNRLDIMREAVDWRAKK